MKSSRLKYQPDANFKLIAIVSNETIARLCWVINKTLRTELNFTEKLKLYNEKLETPQRFSVYSHTNLQGKCVYRLIENKSDLGFLSQKNANVDFIFQCFDCTDEKVSELLNEIRHAEDVNFATIIDQPESALVQKLMI